MTDAFRIRMLRPLAFVLMTGLLGACAHKEPPLYSWRGYSAQVYGYMKEDGVDPAAQAASLEQDLQIARSSNLALPPGFRAHLGLLYLHQGQGDKAVEQWQAEKLAFPESAAFMDFVLRKARGGDGLIVGQAAGDRPGTSAAGSVDTANTADTADTAATAATAKDTR